MRLTLRTLLAYIDGILDTQDQEELSKQIENSDNAKELLHRTSDTTRRIRLGAPPVDSKTHDANAVAEYLDGTMSPEEVMEFERRCLESDPELAEAASTHHILTMVLGQRADVDDDLRRVMYGLPAEQAKMQQAPSATERPRTVVSSTSTEVPDYLKASEQSFIWRVAPAIAALLLLGGAAVVFAPGGLYDQSRAADEVAVNTGSDAEGTDDNAEVLKDGGAGAGESPSTDDSAAPPEGTTDSTEVAPPEAGTPESTSPGETPDPAAGDSLTPEATKSPMVDESGEASAAGGAETPPPVIESPIETPPATSVDSAPVPTVPPTEPPPVTADTTAAGQGVDPVASAEPSESPEGPIDTPPPAPVGPTVVGMVTTPNEVLLRYDTELGDWVRPVRDEGELPNIKTGDRLLSLPSYRSRLRLLGVELSLSGATLIEILPSDRGVDEAIVQLVYGRIIAANTGGEDTQLELRVGAVQGVATLSRGAVVAIEAERPFQAGLDPMVESPPIFATYYAPRGGVEWQGPEGVVTADERSAWRQKGDSVGPVAPDTMEIDWLDGEPLSTLQRRAAAELERNLTGGEPIWPQLAELYDTRRVEEQVQVAISSMHVGHYDPFIRALSDRDQKSYWNREIEAIRATMSRSPELAKSVRDALSEFRGPDDDDDLYQMLCGFSGEEVGVDRQQRQNGALKQLIDWLESDQVDYRVLANYNLEQITNRQGVFNPVGTPESRRPKISRFRTRLERDELIKQERPPAPVSR